MKTSTPDARKHPKPAPAMRTLTWALTTTLLLTLTACSKPSEPPTNPNSATPIAAAQALETVAAGGKGFAVGSMVSAQTVYVFFDPQCPHCGHLWRSTQPLLTKARFVWIPVAIMGAKSVSQGAALLQAPDPLAAMSDHENSLLQGQGGLAATSNVPEALVRDIKSNSDLLNRLGADSVPFLVSTHMGTGQAVTHGGALDTAALQSLLGMNPP